ncbi:pimeloyl-ACP methyl ester carboxylesterase [Litoreibacter ponti]|uniref:Pimeloyl-ACP methyl ester carboxylesterase n=1 Tax=Litoreibacter ponti TaxID=1510457 RepID=A0A2T6BKX8_9RHOB|nr:alpha/beta fold hydrolase [Litoreibacter ponti]PTX56709.1 pimeloyl-ACP methyl ester carboxylesterase [Litoreibacter ponti]
MLNVQTFGDGGTPLIIAHGLFGSGRNWGVIAKRLSDRGRVVTVDMRNHAGSFWSDDHSYEAMAADLAEVIETIGVSSADVLGHSMGGKAGMVLALRRPALVSKLVVADIAPVGYAHSQMQPIEYMRKVDLSRVERRSDVLAQLNGLEAGVPEFIAQSLDIKEKKWRLNLDVLAAEMDGIIGFPDVSGTYEGPALFLSGGNSDYVRSEYRREIKELFPSAKFAKIPGAGHWLHAEKPREFEAAVRVFLDH